MLKKLFKIFLIPIFFCSFLSFCEAKTNHIELGEQINNVRLYIKTNKFPDGKTKNMYQLKNTTTNELVYCIEPGIMLINGDFTEYSNLYDLNIDLSEDDWDYLTRIAYFGYRYTNHNTLKWYTITQYLIWEYIIGETGEIYFVDDNDNKITKYTKEIKEMQELIAQSYLLPDFGLEDNDIYVKYGGSLTLTDQNNILSEYNMSYSYPDKMNINKKGNTLEFDFFKPSTESIFFTRSLNTTTAPKIYYNGESQTLMSRGYYSYQGNYITVTYMPPEVEFIKKPNPDVPLSLKGAVYELYLKRNLDVALTTFTTDELGKFLFNRYEIDDYCLKEIQAPYGFKLNEGFYCFQNDDNKTLYLEEEPILKKIDLEKYLIDYEGNIALEPNAEFELYDDDTNKLITTFKTDELGKHTLTLWYGNYRIHQTESTEGYNLIPDFEFTVDENTIDRDNLVFKNPAITGTLILSKKDSETKELILDTAAFKIKNVDTNEYLTLNGLNIFHTTNGLLKLDNIPYGNYILEEIEPPAGYKISEKTLTFSITKEGEVIELTVLNPKLTGNLKLQKKDLLTKDLILDSATFKIKNVETGEYLEIAGIDEFKTQDGILYLEDIPYGTYLIEEIIPPINYSIIPDIEVTFTISEDGEVITLDMFNLKDLTGSLLIKKVDSLTSNPLSCVHFGLYDSNKNLLGEYITDENGEISLPDLKVGSYYLKELLTLDNYELNTDEIYIEIKNGIKSTVTVNNRRLVPVPRTSTNPEPLIAGFSFLGLLSSLFLLKHAKKES